MSLRKLNRPPQTNLNQSLSKIAYAIVICSILLILVGTLSPFNFSSKGDFSVQQLIGKFNHTTHLSDQINNVLLFIPLGFGLTCLLHTKRLGAITKLLTVLLLSAGLSFIVEVLQVLLPSRSPTPDDILNNTAGGCLGFFCFYLWKSQLFSYIFAFIEKHKYRFSVKTLTAIFIVYIALAFLIPMPLQQATSLSNWDLTFPLLLGNERTGDRPWRGYISEVYIADTAVSNEEVAQLLANTSSLTKMSNSLVGAYQLTGKENYPDKTGNLPNLVWRGQPPNFQESKGIFLTSARWLETATPVTFMNRKIRTTDQFTIETTVATAGTNQFGPARIVSVSNNTVERNFTLGQDRKNLVFRLRTPINGKNAGHLLQIVPEVFTDTKFHHIIITYADSVLKIYIDEVQNFHSFNLLQSIPINDKLLYYGLMFIPLGLLLALVITLSKTRLIFCILFFIGVLLPALIVEILLANWSDRSVNLENLLLSILILGGTMLMLKWLSRNNLQSNEAN